MRLILTRHGQTVENKEGIIQGHMPGKLSEEGIEQARKLALRLKDEKIDCIYSSDLKRAADTAKEIARYHPNTPFHRLKELRERDHGSLSGKNKNEVDWSSFWDVDGETEEQMSSRAKAFIDKIYEQHKGGTVLIVGHGAINKILTLVILNKRLDKSDLARQRNASVTIFKFREDRNHEIHLMDCVKHLE